MADINDIVLTLNNQPQTPLNVLINNILATLQDYRLQASNSIIFTSSNAAGSIAASTDWPVSISVAKAGTINVMVNCRATGSGRRVSLFINGVRYGSIADAPTITTTFADYTFNNVPVAAGDILTLQFYGGTGEYNANAIKVGADIVSPAVATAIIQEG